MVKQFYFKQLILTCPFLAQSLIVKQCYKVLPLRAAVELRAMSMKKYSAFLEVSALLEPHHQIV